MEFSGKSVIVTGGGKGIGRATVALLAARGAQVVALSRTQSDLDELSSQTGCHGIVADLAVRRRRVPPWWKREPATSSSIARGRTCWKASST